MWKRRSKHSKVKNLNDESLVMILLILMSLALRAHSIGTLDNLM